MNVHVSAAAGVAIKPDDRTFRVRVLSDLRVHEQPLSLPPLRPEEDAVVVAGNVRPGLAAAVRWLAAAFERGRADRRLVLVPGQLEFEDGVPVPEALDQGAEAARAVGVDLLHDSATRLGDPEEAGLHVLGATLWPAFTLTSEGKGAQSRGHGRHRWKACRKVTAAPHAPFLPHDAVGAHARSRAWVEDALCSVWAGGDGHGHGSAVPVVTGIRGGDRAIVATGFPPLRDCLPPQMARPLGDLWSPAWHASDLGQTLDSFSAPALWLHGGVPHALDMRVGRTRFVANPRGARPADGFDPGRVVAV